VFTKKQLNSIHNYNEHIPISNFLKGIDVFDQFIGELIAHPYEKHSEK
jgi:acetylornithine deacetylase/succinyl-diaminopimelate desuccinylase-like protein